MKPLLFYLVFYMVALCILFNEFGVYSAPLLYTWVLLNKCIHWFLLE